MGRRCATSWPRGPLRLVPRFERANTPPCLPCPVPRTRARITAATPLLIVAFRNRSLRPPDGGHASFRSYDCIPGQFHLYSPSGGRPAVYLESRGSYQVPKWAQVEIEVLIFEAEHLLQRVHLAARLREAVSGERRTDRGGGARPVRRATDRMQL